MDLSFNQFSGPLVVTSAQSLFLQGNLLSGPISLKDCEEWIQGNMDLSGNPFTGTPDISQCGLELLNMNNTNICGSFTSGTPCSGLVLPSRCTAKPTSEFACAVQCPAC
jgi:hypothetical protein